MGTELKLLMVLVMLYLIYLSDMSSACMKKCSLLIHLNGGSALTHQWLSRKKKLNLDQLFAHVIWKCTMLDNHLHSNTHSRWITFQCQELIVFFYRCRHVCLTVAKKNQKQNNDVKTHVSMLLETCNKIIKPINICVVYIYI